MDPDRDDTPEEASGPPDDGADRLRADGALALEWIAEYLDRLPELPVLSRGEPGDLLAALPGSGPEHGRPFQELIADLDERILPGITHWNHPRFFAYFSNTGSVPGILGAAIAGALNPNGMLWRTSPAATELEQRVVAWLAEWLGLPSTLFGIINDTASTSSLVALAAARHACPAYDADRGAASVPAGMVIYASEQAHSSIEKAAMILGLGRSAVRKIPTDARYRMQVERLVEAIAEDRRAGRTPFAVVATLGTTATTSLDPAAAIADVCARQNLWMHVDAAYAGPAALVPELRPLFEGWERADSIVLNPHKWLFTPMCSSVLYTRRPEMLRAAFNLVPEYLRGDVGDHRGRAGADAAPDSPGSLPPDFMNYGVQLGRPFRALRLWMVLCTYGRATMEAVLREHVTWARALGDRIDGHEHFERLAPTPFSTVCFRFRPDAGAAGSDGTELDPVEHDPWAAANEKLMERVNRAGVTFLSHARLRGRLALRVAIGNLRTRREDVELAWRSILDAAEGLES